VFHARGHERDRRDDLEQPGRDRPRRSGPECVDAICRMNAMPEAIAALHRELGIPSDYARRRGLAFCTEARDLVDVVAANGHAGSTPTIRLTRDAADGWRSLHMAARRDGIELLLLSGFRSIERQTEIIRRKLARGQSIESI